MIFCGSLNSGWENAIQLIVSFVILIIVLLLTAFTTKWIGGFQKAQFANKHMKPIESMKIGNNKFLQLVKVGEVYLVVGVGKEEVHTIAMLTKDDLPELEQLDFESKTTMQGNFKEILSKFSNKDSRKKHD